MSDNLRIAIKILTAWILKAFSAIVPMGTGARMGTASMGLLFRPGYSLPLYNFSPTSENFFSFSSLPTDYCILPTATLGAFPKMRPPVRIAPGSARAGIGSARVAPGSVRVSPVSVRVTQGSGPILKQYAAGSSRESGNRNPKPGTVNLSTLSPCHLDTYSEAGPVQVQIHGIHFTIPPGRANERAHQGKARAV